MAKLNGQYGVRLLLLGLTGLRLAVAARAPLSADEAYYWVWSRALAGGYLDHPPMVALWMRVGAAVAGDTALGVRLLGPVSALLGTLLLMRAAEDLFPGRRAGPIAGVLLNATLVLGVGSVVMTPDTPLLFFWVATLAALARLLRTENPAWWLAVGAASGLALDSKYTAALLGASLAVWLVAVPGARRWLACWQLWAGGALALALFTPVLSWNAAHGWVSFAKQGGRAEDFHPARALQFLAELVVGQIGLATPWLAWVLAAGVATSARDLWRRQPAPSLLVCLVLVPALVFVAHALGGRVQANWPAVIFPGAVLAAAGSTARFWRPAAVLGLVCALAVYVQAAAPILSLPRAMDFTLIRLAGWSDLAGQVFAAELAAGAAYVAADEYSLASELAWHLRSPVVAVEPRWAMFDLDSRHPDAGPGLLVRSVRQGGGPDPRLWSDIRLVGTATRSRFGRVAETYRLYKVRWSPPPGSTPATALLPVPRANLLLKRP